MLMLVSGKCLGCRSSVSGLLEVGQDAQDALMGVAHPLITPSLFAASKELSEQITHGLETSDKVLGTIRGTAEGIRPAHLLQTPEGYARRMADTPADFRALRSALCDLDKGEVWGGLSAVPRPEDQTAVIYVCRQHYLALQYPHRPT
ncbi:hypothetical protein [Streptacidiphilus sp. EB103A]|uniref:hypothetical protein n=1 Tax=Streptacidiphilus sp. EB103A TaxID=3156275 RepID=UPI0035121CE0